MPQKIGCKSELLPLTISTHTAGLRSSDMGAYSAIYLAPFCCCA